jgi:hypothetical protein
MNIVEHLRAARRHAEAIRQDAARSRNGVMSDFLNAVFH